MFSFPSVFKKNSVVLLIEIGSAKVTLSLVKYSPDDIEFLWFTEQTASYKGVLTKEQKKKALISTLTNVLLTFNSEGLPFLNKNHKGSTITEAQVSTSSPWSYILLKKIQLTADDTIHLTKDSLDTLVSEIEYVKKDAINTNSLTNLKEASRSVLQIRLNDYVFDDISDFEAETAEIDVAISMIEGHLYESLHDLIKKVLPYATLHIASSIVVFTQAMKVYEPELSEYTFINLTMEATEVAIVRNGTISFVNFNNYGIVSLARDLEEVIAIPYYSIINYIQSSTMTDLKQSLSEAKQKKVDQVLESFINKTNELFQQIDDGYLLSKTIYLHTPICTCNYIKSIVEKSVNSVSGDKHKVIDVDKKFSDYFHDTLNSSKNTSIYPCSILFTGVFFHKIKNRRIHY